jgi:hypothetical protein
MTNLSFKAKNINLAFRVVSTFSLKQYSKITKLILKLIFLIGVQSLFYIFIIVFLYIYNQVDRGIFWNLNKYKILISNEMLSARGIAYALRMKVTVLADG